MSTEFKANTKAKIEEVVQAVQAEGEEPEADSGSESEEEDDEAPQASSSTTPAGATKKKGKKKAKAAAKALSAVLKGDKIPQQLVDEVLNRVKQEQGDGAEGADEATVRMALEQMKIMDVLKGKTGVGGKNKKETGGHKVCSLYFQCGWDLMGRCTVLVDAASTSDWCALKHLPCVYTKNSSQETRSPRRMVQLNPHYLENK